VNRRLALALAALMLATVLVPAASARQGADVERAYLGDDPSEASPGQRGVLLTVEFRNVDDVKFRAVEAELDANDHLKPAFEGAGTDDRTATLDPDEVWKAQFRVNLAENLTANSEIEIPVDLQMRADEAKNTCSEGNYWRSSHDVTVYVPGRTLAGADTHRDRLATEQRLEVPITVANTGDGEAGTLDVSSASPSDSGLDVRSPQTSVRIDQLAPDANRTLPVTLLTPDATGVHELDVTIEYANAVGAPETVTRTVPFVVASRGEASVRVGLADATVTAGRVNPLSFTVENRGENRMRDVILDVNPASSSTRLPEVVPLNGTGHNALGTLDPNTSTRVPVSVLVARQASDVQPLTVAYTWTDPSGFERTETRNVGLVVEGAIDVQLCGHEARLDDDRPVDPRGPPDQHQQHRGHERLPADPRRRGRRRNADPLPGRPRPGLADPLHPRHASQRLGRARASPARDHVDQRPGTGPRARDAGRRA